MAIDIWAVGCVFAELLLGRPLFQGENSVQHMLSRMVMLLGSPNDQIWPGFSQLPDLPKYRLPQQSYVTSFPFPRAARLCVR